MASGQVMKRAKYKITVKDPGTPGVLKMVLCLTVLYSIPCNVLSSIP